MGINISPALKNRVMVCTVTIILLISCSDEKNIAKGTLYIIGGGNRTDAMMEELTKLAGVTDKGYVYILPMASSVPDSSIMWAAEDFIKAGAKSINGYNFRKGEMPPVPKLDSLKQAPLIYLCGGDQSRFMEVVRNTPIMDAVLEAYRNGSVIAGTSAGAAVMSKKMITGNQKKHPESDSGFTTMEAENIEITEGLGLLTDAIIDQHFIKRQRLNRLVSVSIENPGQLCIGIDESTAIIVKGNIAKVTGNSQVVVIRNRDRIKRVSNGLLGAEGLILNVYLPGEEFSLR